MGFSKRKKVEIRDQRDVHFPRGLGTGHKMSTIKIRFFEGRMIEYVAVLTYEKGYDV